MKNLAKTLAMTAMLGSAFASTAALAEQKIGVIDVQEVFRQMPQAVEIQNAIQAEFKDRVAEVKKLQEDGEYYAQRLTRDAATLSEDEKNELRTQIEGVRQQLAEKVQPLQQEMQARDNQERAKLLGLIRQAMDAVAADEGYDVVLNGNAVAFAKEEFDLSQKVLEKVSKIN